MDLSHHTGICDICKKRRSGRDHSACAAARKAANPNKERRNFKKQSASSVRYLDRQMSRISASDAGIPVEALDSLAGMHADAQSSKRGKPYKPPAIDPQPCPQRGRGVRPGDVDQRWTTVFGAWIRDYGVDKLVATMRSQGHSVTESGVYFWTRGKAVPRIDKAEAMIAISGGALTLAHIYEHRHLIKQPEAAQ